MPTWKCGLGTQSGGRRYGGYVGGARCAAGRGTQRGAWGWREVRGWAWDAARVLARGATRGVGLATRVRTAYVQCGNRHRRVQTTGVQGGNRIARTRWMSGMRMTRRFIFDASGEWAVRSGVRAFGSQMIRRATRDAAAPTGCPEREWPGTRMAQRATRDAAGTAVRPESEGRRTRDVAPAVAGDATLGCPGKLKMAPGGAAPGRRLAAQELLQEIQHFNCKADWTHRSTTVAGRSRIHRMIRHPTCSDTRDVRTPPPWHYGQTDSCRTVSNYFGKVRVITIHIVVRMCSPKYLQSGESPGTQVLQGGCPIRRLTSASDPDRQQSHSTAPPEQPDHTGSRVVGSGPT